MLQNRFTNGLVFKVAVLSTILLGATSTTVALIYVAVAYNRAVSRADVERQQKIEDVARVVELIKRSNIEPAVELKKTFGDERLLANGFIAVYDRDGKAIFQTDAAPAGTVTEIGKSAPEQNLFVSNDWQAERRNVADAGLSVIGAYRTDDSQITQEFYDVLYSWMLTAAVFTLLSGALLALTMYWLARRLRSAIAATEQIADGDLSAEIEITSHDEIGQLQAAIKRMLEYLRETAATADKIADGDLAVKINPKSNADRFGAAFQNMIERTLKMVQTQTERDAMQRSIMKLLDEVADVAEGDLTAEAEVTADATGAIADAFNYMILELRTLIRSVKQTSLQVDDSAMEMRATTETMMHRSELQNEQLIDLSQTLDEMSKQMQKVADDMNLSAHVSGSALDSVQRGTAHVASNISAMTRLRGRVQETSERIKRLGERSQEISSIVKIINDLAQRTSVLALNASIQAAAAGNQGRGFVAVAEEVERLADRSAQASKQIDVLTKAIQGETSEAVTAMETTVKDVLLGVKLTDEVGGTLHEIEIITAQLAEISHNIAHAARVQTQNSINVSGSMRAAAQVSQTNTTEMKQTANSASLLATWAQELRTSIAPFRLPEDALNELPRREDDAPAASFTGQLSGVNTVGV